MKREEKNALSRQRILDGALREFSQKGYHAASMNTICVQNDISKGIIYHYFKDKDELYLLCAADCFEKLTAYLKETAGDGTGTVEARLQAYFDARLRFFTQEPVYLGIFLNATMNPPPHLTAEIAAVKKPFDEQNIAIFTRLLESVPLRTGITVSAVVEDSRMYMDYFNARLRVVFAETEGSQRTLQEHEERCYRQLSILLYGVLGRENAQR